MAKIFIHLLFLLCEKHMKILLASSDTTFEQFEMKEEFTS